MGKINNLGICISECIYEQPCKHCLSYSSLNGHGSLDFSLIEKVVQEAKEAELRLERVSISGGEPMTYNSNGKTLADVVGLFPKSTGISIATNILGERPDLAQQIRTAHKKIYWRLSYHEWSERDHASVIRESLHTLRELNWPPNIYLGKVEYFSKEIQVSGITKAHSRKLAKKLASKLADEYVLAKYKKDTLLLVNRADDKDVVPVYLSRVYWEGEAKKNFRFDKITQDITMPMCPVLLKDSACIINNGDYILCEPSSNLPKIGNVKDMSLVEALELREEIGQNILRMLSKNLHKCRENPCGYCKDNLGFTKRG